MRLQWIDTLRCSAIVLMVLFHLNYSLVHIFDLEILNFSESFWFFLGKISALSFIFLAGFSCFLAEQKYGKEVQKKYLRYAVILWCFALLISFFTYFLFPEQFIAFGILHFFALSFLLLPYFTRFWYWLISLAGAIILSGAYFLPVVESALFFPLGFRTADFFSADYLDELKELHDKLPPMSKDEFEEIFNIAFTDKCFKSFDKIAFKKFLLVFEARVGFPLKRPIQSSSKRTSFLIKKLYKI